MISRGAQSILVQNEFYSELFYIALVSCELSQVSRFANGCFLVQAYASVSELCADTSVLFSSTSTMPFSSCLLQK